MAEIVGAVTFGLGLYAWQQWTAADQRRFFKDCENGRLDLVQKFTKSGGNVNLQDGNGRTPLMLACINGHVDVTKELVIGTNSATCEIDKQDNKGLTALMFAAVYGNQGVVKELANAKCDLDRQDNNGETALMKACGHNHGVVVKELISRGCKLDTENNENKTALHIALKNKHVHCAQKLIEAGCEINRQDEDGKTALMIAGENGLATTCKQLMTKPECDVTLTGNRGETAYDLLPTYIRQNVTVVNKDFGERTPKVYRMDGRGLVLIINIKTFKNQPESWTRHGSELDVENLKVLFNETFNKYDVTVKIDCTMDDLKSALQQAKDKLKAKHFVQFFCFIFSHGYEGGILTYDCGKLSYETIFQYFKGNNLPEMIDLPKVFVFQACRGEEPQPVVATDDVSGCQSGGSVEVMETSYGVCTLPVDADIVAAFSTTKGYVSFRSVLSGSWFISNVCDVFKAHYKQRHLLDLLTIVNYRVTEDKCAVVGQQRTFKQMPIFESTLRMDMNLLY